MTSAEEGKRGVDSGEKLPGAVDGGWLGPVVGAGEAAIRGAPLSRGLVTAASPKSDLGAAHLLDRDDGRVDPDVGIARLRVIEKPSLYESSRLSASNRVWGRSSLAPQTNKRPETLSHWGASP